MSTAQMLACTAALSWMTHGDGGAVLALGRRRRRPSSAIRRAARERDGCRCRFRGASPAGPTCTTSGTTPLPASPPLPAPQGSISQTHDAAITPDTIIPPWYGERLDLHHAIWACFANARTWEERKRGQDGDQAERGRVTVYEPEDWPERYRQYRENTPQRTGSTLIPIQV